MCMAFDKTQSPQHRGMIQNWLEYVSNNTMWCKSYMFTIAGYTFLAVSTPQSTRQGTDNVFRNFINATILMDINEIHQSISNKMVNGF